MERHLLRNRKTAPSKCLMHCSLRSLEIAAYARGGGELVSEQPRGCIPRLWGSFGMQIARSQKVRALGRPGKGVNELERGSISSAILMYGPVTGEMTGKPHGPPSWRGGRPSYCYEDYEFLSCIVFGRAGSIFSHRERSVVKRLIGFDTVR